MIKELLEERKLPELMVMNDGTPVTAENAAARRLEIIDKLEHYEYGRFPKICGETTWEVKHVGEFCGGTSKLYNVEITFPTEDGESFTFPVSVNVPDRASAENKLPAFVFISFGYPYYYPVEEVSDSDVIVAEMIMNNVAFDGEDNYSALLSKHLVKDGKREPETTGKIGMWAFAACRVLDYLLAQDYVDPAHAGVVGHSRLGKTALWAGANDERFTHVFSNDSGCSGAAITRKKVGETFPVIRKAFPYWFCENMKDSAESIEISESLPFDQHFLVAAIAPRHAYVNSATEDSWADPVSEFLACAAASPMWEAYGKTGFVTPDKLPEDWDTLQDGSVGYHLRPGTHFHSRHDWMRQIEFLKK